MSSILDIDHISKIHPNQERNYLFSSVTASINEPDIISVLGTSGQGKSTLLRILGLLDIPDDGSIRLHGNASNQWIPTEWRMHVTYISQQAIMLSGTVEENLMTVSRLHLQPFDRSLAHSLMENVGLHEMNWSKKASELSGGEKQRVALVRSLLLRPEVLLLDEVTASLDVHSQHAVEATLMEWHRKEGATLIWVTHNLNQARLVSKRIWFMGDGTLLEDGDKHTFFQSPQTETARAFLQSPNGHIE